jgi:predicted nucleotide-binding protein (sugar kinase/HSP70/actin superfamily)
MIIGLPAELLHLEPVWELRRDLAGRFPDLEWRHSPSNPDLGLGRTLSEGDACFPYKKVIRTACGLAPEVDLLLVPRLVRLDGYLTCPNFRALPDLVGMNLDRGAANGSRPRLLSPCFDESGPKDRLESMRRLGQDLAQATGRRPAAEGGSGQASTQKAGSDPVAEPAETASCIGLLGHPYMLGDRRLNGGIPELLNSRGYTVLTPASMDFTRLDELAAERDYYAKTLYWRFARETLGGYLAFSRDRSVAGIIYLISFNCGLDALLRVELEALQRQAGRTVPLLIHVGDEHTQRDHVVTRIEAFLDILDGTAGN